MSDETIVSVRGGAHRIVAPDYAILDAALAVAPAPRSTALEALRASEDQLTASLTRLGGVALTVGAQRADLAWSIGGVSVHDEHRYDESSGEHRLTGDVLARASVTITARDFAQLPRLSETLAAIEYLQLSGVRWCVDDDNEAWQFVRADAIHAALAKADDYAAALGGTVVKVDHVADAGLLDSDGGSRQQRFPNEVPAGSMSRKSGSDGAPLLDPVPQEIHAVIEARVTARTNPAVDR